MKLLDNYFTLQKQIYEHFGYVEGWTVIPLDDSTEMFWSLDENIDLVRYATTPEFLASRDGDYYEDEIYTQRHLPRSVYPADDYTLICCDTETDGNKFLSVFDNAKRVEVPE